MFSLGRGQNWFPLLINMLLSCKLGSGDVEDNPDRILLQEISNEAKRHFHRKQPFQRIHMDIGQFIHKSWKGCFPKKLNSFYMPANTTTFCSLLIKGTIFHPLPFAFIVYSMALIRADVWISLFPNMVIWGVRRLRNLRNLHMRNTAVRNLHMRSRAAWEIWEIFIWGVQPWEIFIWGIQPWEIFIWGVRRLRNLRNLHMRNTAGWEIFIWGVQSAEKSEKSRPGGNHKKFSSDKTLKPNKFYKQHKIFKLTNVFGEVKSKR